VHPWVRGVEEAAEDADRVIGSDLSLEIPSAIYETIVDRIETGVYALDRDKRIVYWNHGAEQVTGYLRQEVLGREYRGDLVVESE
jgi:PAS domain-containing protein